MVTLVSETFYKQKLESVCGGYLELDVQVEGVTVLSCGVLVLKRHSGHC